MSERPLRILMVVPLYPAPVRGGLERQAHELSKELAARGHNVTALSYRHTPGQAAVEVVDGVNVIRIAYWPTSILQAILVPIQLVFSVFVLRDRFDVLHAHTNSWFCAVGILTGRIISKPTLFKLAGVGVFGIPGLRARFSGRLRLKIFSGSSGIVAMNGDSLAELAEIEYPNRRILFCPNGIDISSPTPPRAKVSEAVRVVFVGRLNYEKRIDDLLIAWSKIPRSAGRKELILVGEGPERCKLEALATTLRVTDTVTFLGHVEDVSAILASSDVFILPSECEGNSNAVLEAMRAGLPVLATDLAGSRVQLGDDAEEFLFPVGDVERMAALIEQMIASSSLRIKAGAASRARVEELFGMGKVADEYEATYRALSAGGHADLAAIGAPVSQRLDAN